MGIQENLEINTGEIRNSCIRINVRSLFYFELRDEMAGEKPCVRFLVDLEEPDPLKRGEFLWNFWGEVEAILNCKIDLLTPTSIRNPVVKEIIEKRKVLLYAR